MEGFSKQPESSLDTAAAFSRWLASYDSLLKRLNKHDVYVYMRAEEDADDHADAEADEILETARRGWSRPRNACWGSWVSKDCTRLTFRTSRVLFLPARCRHADFRPKVRAPQLRYLGCELTVGSSGIRGSLIPRKSSPKPVTISNMPTGM